MSICPPARRRLLRHAAALTLSTGIIFSGASVVGATSAPSTPSAPASVNVVGLQYGDRGPAVTALQNALVRVGVGVMYGVDGHFGSATRASVRAFQTSKGLSVDRRGRCGHGPGARAVDRAGGGSCRSGPDLVGDAGDGQLGPSGRRPPTCADQQRVRARRWRRRVLRPGDRDRRASFPTGQGSQRDGRRRRHRHSRPWGSPPVPPRTARRRAHPPTVSWPLGSRGAEVAAMQQALVTAGYPMTGGADGIFGPATADRAQALPGGEGSDPDRDARTADQAGPSGRRAGRTARPGRSRGPGAGDLGASV